MKKQIVTIEINSLNEEGKGLGTFTDLSGACKEAAVPFCMPGDIVEASVHRKKRGEFPAHLHKIVKESPHRITPRCCHFASCGGCSFQEIPYPEQLVHKQNQVATKFEGLRVPHPIIGCELPYGYRNKMEFTFSQNRQKERFLGLFLAGARGKVFTIKECHLISPWFNEVLEKVYHWWGTTSLSAYFPPKDTGTLRTLTLRESFTTKKRLAMLTVSGNPDFALHRPELESFTRLFGEDDSVFMKIHQAIKGRPTEFYEMHLKGPEFIEETISSIHFQISPSAFFQPNTQQASILYQEALRLASLSPSDVVYDLYCGTGTLGLLASRFVHSVIGIELSLESSLDARENAKRNGIKNIEILTGSVGEILQKKKEISPPTVILLDPPRSGLDPLSIQEVIALNCPKIVYISCNPTTQARDVKIFLNAGYSLTHLQPVDQFPHTPHIENIAILQKKVMH